MITSPLFAGKRYVVLGLARSGLAAAEALLASGAEVTAWDAREEPRAALEGRATLTDPLTIDLAPFHAVVVSPGVPLNRHPIAEAAAVAGVPVIGDVELFAEARSSLPPHRVVGITGTNGKSTTTALVAHILETAGVPVLMGGNIGLPIMGEQPLTPNASGVGVYVLELSSYQIDLTRELDCDVAVLLNITPDHLDRYADYGSYAASKARLFAMLSPERYAVVDERAEQQHRVLHAAPSGLAVKFIDRVPLPGDQADWPALQGPHNRANAAAAVATARALDVDEAVIARALISFTGLPHRMERVAEAGGVQFVNDSKATNPDSTAPALGAYPPAADGRARIHWIAGGLPKDDNLDACLPYLGNVAAAYVIGEAGPLFAELLGPHVPVRRSEMMTEAVRQAISSALPGDVVLLSPACASFDQFRDYEARGDAFRRIVEAYLAEPDLIEPGAADHAVTTGGQG